MIKEDKPLEERIKEILKSTFKENIQTGRTVADSDDIFEKMNEGSPVEDVVEMIGRFYYNYGLKNTGRYFLTWMTKWDNDMIKRTAYMFLSQHPESIYEMFNLERDDYKRDEDYLDGKGFESIFPMIENTESDDIRWRGICIIRNQLLVSKEYADNAKEQRWLTGQRKKKKIERYYEYKVSKFISNLFTKDSSKRYKLKSSMKEYIEEIIFDIGLDTTAKIINQLYQKGQIQSRFVLDGEYFAKLYRKETRRNLNENNNFNKTIAILLAGLKRRNNHKWKNSGYENKFLEAQKTFLREFYLKIGPENYSISILFGGLDDNRREFCINILKEYLNIAYENNTETSKVIKYLIKKSNFEDRKRTPGLWEELLSEEKTQKYILSQVFRRTFNHYNNIDPNYDTERYAVSTATNIINKLEDSKKSKENIISTMKTMMLDEKYEHKRVSEFFSSIIKNYLEIKEKDTQQQVKGIHELLKEIETNIDTNRQEELVKQDEGQYVM